MTSNLRRHLPAVGSFINELGNRINVEVKTQDIDSYPGVLITIEGPTSISENHITRKEAEVLYERLGKALRK